MKIDCRFAIDLLETRRLLATVSWDNGGDGSNWNDPLNWTGDVVPATGDDAVISSAWTWRGTITLSGQHQLRSVQAAVRLRVLGSLLVDTASTLNQLSLEGGTIGGAGSILVQLEQMPTSVWTSGTFKGPGVITFNSPLEMRDGGPGTVRKIDGAALRGGGITFVSGVLTVGDSTGTAPKIIAAALPTTGTTGFTWNGTLNYTNTGTRPLEVEAWTQVNLNPGAGQTRDFTSVKYWDLGGNLSVGSGTVKMRDTSFSRVFLNASTSVLEVSGTTFWKAINGGTVSPGTLRFVGGSHSFLWEQSATPARLEVTAGATLNVAAAQSLQNIVLDHATIRSSSSLGSATVTSNGGTFDYSFYAPIFQFTVSGTDPTTLPSPFSATRMDVLSGATLYLGPTSPGTGVPDYHSAELLYLAANATVTGSYAQLLGRRLTATGVNALIDTPLYSEMVISEAGASLTLRGDVVQARNGILTGNWTPTGEILLDGIAPIHTNRAFVGFTGPMTQFPALSNLLANEGELSFSAGAIASITGLARNDGTISLSGGAQVTVPSAFVNAKTLLLDNSQLVFGADLQLLSTSSIRIGFVAPQVVAPVTVAGSLTLGGTLLTWVPDSNYSASLSPLMMQANSITSQFAQSSASTLGLIRDGRAVVTATQVLMDFHPADPQRLEMDAGSDTGFSSTDEKTNDTTPTFTVRSYDIGSIRFLIDDVLVEERPITQPGEVNHTFTPTNPIPDGDHVMKVVMVDEQGNPSPGQTTLPFAIDTVAPFFLSGSLDLSSRVRVFLQFSEAIFPGNANNIRFVDFGSHAEYRATSLFNDQGNRTLRADYVPNLPDANWTVSFVNMEGVKDSAGNSVMSWGWDFFILAGDLNRDRTVGFDDLLTLTQNYGKTGRTFYQGNLNYDSSGRVNFDDLLIMAQRYGRYLAPPTTPLVALTERSRRAGGAMNVIDSI